MNRIISALGGVLVLIGAGILAYVGVTYAESVHSAVHVRTWSRSEAQAGTRLAARLAARQQVSIPRSLHAGKAQAKHVIAPNEPALRVVMPKINVNAPVVQTPPVGGVWDVADWAVGHLTTTPNPGAPGNAAYAAHDDIKGEIFKRLGELSPGDAVLIYTRSAVYHYVVVRERTVDPSDVSVLNSTTQPTATFISCVPYWVDTQRLAVQAVLKSTTAR